MTDKPGAFYATYLPSNHEIIKNSTKYEYQSQNVYHLQLKMYVYNLIQTTYLYFSIHNTMLRNVLKQTFRAFTFRNFRKLFVTH